MTITLPVTYALRRRLRRLLERWRILRPPPVPAGFQPSLRYPTGPVGAEMVQTWTRAEPPRYYARLEGTTEGVFLEDRTALLEFLADLAGEGELGPYLTRWAPPLAEAAEEERA
jgi:hypothetical protein